MGDPYESALMAHGKIRLAICRLAEAFPFHAAILERVTLTVRPEVGTMAVTVSGRDVLIYHNPMFVLAVTADERGGVLVHEAHHVLFRERAKPGAKRWPTRLARCRLRTEVMRAESVPLIVVHDSGARLEEQHPVWPGLRAHDRA
jgi:hypothetical protein